MPKVGLELTTLRWRVTFSADLATQVLLIYFDYRHHLSVPSPSAELFNLLHWWNATSILNEIRFGLGYKRSWFCFPDGSPLDFICNRQRLFTDCLAPGGSLRTRGKLVLTLPGPSLLQLLPSALSFPHSLPSHLPSVHLYGLAILEGLCLLCPLDSLEEHKDLRCPEVNVDKVFSQHTDVVSNKQKSCNKFLSFQLGLWIRNSGWCRIPPLLTPAMEAMPIGNRHFNCYFIMRFPKMVWISRCPRPSRR